MGAMGHPVDLAKPEVVGASLHHHTLFIGELADTMQPGHIELGEGTLPEVFM